MRVVANDVRYINSVIEIVRFGESRLFVKEKNYGNSSLYN